MMVLPYWLLYFIFADTCFPQVGNVQSTAIEARQSLTVPRGRKASMVMLRHKAKQKAAD